MRPDAVNYHDYSGLANLRKEASDNPDDAIPAVARQFESLFIQMVMKSMRNTVPDGGLIDQKSLRHYQEMADSQMAVSMAENGGIGLAETIERQLSRTPPSPESIAVTHALRAPQPEVD